MVPEVCSLYQFAGEGNTPYPFSIQDYQRYVYGDDKRAHQFGTDLAKAFIATRTSNQSFTHDIAVAVLSDSIPTATHGLRRHFVAYLNRHLISLNARPVLTIDVFSVGQDAGVLQDVTKENSKDLYHIDVTRLAGRSLIVLGDIRTAHTREDHMTQSLRNLNLDNPIVFAYIAAVEGLQHTAGLTSLMALIVGPTIKDIETIAQAANFTMNQSFVHYLLGRDYAGFCSFVRRQDDFFARLLLDYAIAGLYYNDEDYRQNFDFLLWEVEARESV
ncbi:hypothetical protein IAQ61_010581 [Plenodomus lingam]|uniref:Uncharacterized protein n=1 Tax=Leptosphaeria maculans (strain JN3 / isolate v23.1.3 / race Av1-4-5-6-7-8) TaxID=985895 RepID=E4ZIV8_LEPMJ|nr:hypothetical protein LEMA_P067360.1 [Plenodomus lingam JN3]KAH9860847.1 hypothetical protein IAQ61_010581 [Plenodomus lingam]CBX91228.1 hypothetical protein LEMA_P067360.1 [Plenodomus lingam JN3]